MIPPSYLFKDAFRQAWLDPEPEAPQPLPERPAGPPRPARRLVPPLPASLRPVGV